MGISYWKQIGAASVAAMKESRTRPSTLDHVCGNQASVALMGRAGTQVQKRYPSKRWFVLFPRFPYMYQVCSGSPEHFLEESITSLFTRPRLFNKGFSKRVVALDEEPVSSTETFHQFYRRNQSHLPVDATVAPLARKNQIPDPVGRRKQPFHFQ